MAGAGHLHKRRALQVPNAPQKADRTGVGLQTGENRWVRTFIPNFIVRLKIAPVKQNSQTEGNFLEKMPKHLLLSGRTRTLPAA